MQWGLSHTAHEVFVEMDGDLSHRPDELPVGIRMIAENLCDVAIASKYLPGSAVLYRPWGRRAVSKVCSHAVRLLLSRRIRDYSNGYRFYTRQAAQLAAEHRSRYGSPIYLSEILALWMHYRLRVVEFQSIYVGRNEGVSKLRIVDLFKAAAAVFEIALRFHLLGFPREHTGGDRTVSTGRASHPFSDACGPGAGPSTTVRSEARNPQEPETGCPTTPSSQLVGIHRRQ